MMPYPWRKDTPIPGIGGLAEGWQEVLIRLSKPPAKATAIRRSASREGLNSIYVGWMNFTLTGEATLSIWPVGVSRPVCWSIW